MKSSRTDILPACLTLAVVLGNFFVPATGESQLAEPDTIQTFAVGYLPFGLASDGSNIWVVNNGDFTVTKLRASDGRRLGTFPVGSYPGYLVFDGASMWVGNSGDDTVTKL